MSEANFVINDPSSLCILLRLISLGERPGIQIYIRDDYKILNIMMLIPRPLTVLLGVACQDLLCVQGLFDYGLLDHRKTLSQV